jgi:hypothetical protein
LTNIKSNLNGNIFLYRLGDFGDFGIVSESFDRIKELEYSQQKNEKNTH